MSLQGIVQQGTGELAGSAPIAPDVTPARPRRFGLIGEVLLRLSAGLVLGARVPIVLTSRADSLASRVASVALAVLWAAAGAAAGET